MTTRTFLTSCALSLVLTAQVIAGEPFTTSSTGSDWRTASLEYRKKYCELMATANQRSKPGITGQVIFDSLQEFYTTDDKNLMKTKIVEIVALTVTVYGK